MKFQYISLLSVASFSAACTDNKEEALLLMPDVAVNYSEIVSASYADSVTTAQALDSSVGALLSSPVCGHFPLSNQGGRIFCIGEVLGAHRSNFGTLEDGPIWLEMG